MIVRCDFRWTNVISANILKECGLEGHEFSYTKIRNYKSNLFFFLYIFFYFFLFLCISFFITTFKRKRLYFSFLRFRGVLLWIYWSIWSTCFRYVGVTDLWGNVTSKIYPNNKNLNRARNYTYFKLTVKVIDSYRDYHQI